MAGDAVLNPEKNQEPLVSVLVPSYNHEKYVVECLESIKSLTYRRLELIVSDDCSRDGTFALAEQWAQRNADRFERTLIVRQDKNLGIVGNLQFLFNNAQGDYLAYIASDDMFVESAIERRVEMFQNDRNVDAIFGNAHIISDSGTLLQEDFLPMWFAKQLSSRRLLVSSLLLHWRIPGPVMMLKKESVLEGGSLGLLPIDLKAEDKYTYIRLASRGRLRFMNSVVAKYRILPGSMCRPFPGARFNTELHVQSDKMNRHLLSGFNRFVIDNRIARHTLELNKSNVSLYGFRVFILRCITFQLRAILFMCALFVKGK